MIHKFTKFALYFNKKKYWTLSDNDTLNIESVSGLQFLNLKDRLEDKHYNKFDKNGLPLRFVNGKVSYNYTTICSYALANWQLYLESGDKKHTVPLLNAINYLYKTGSSTEYCDSGIFLYSGNLSAMNQGQALSILARAYVINKNENYIEFAKKIILPFEVLIENRVVKAHFKTVNNVFWYEEYPQTPPKMF